VIDEIEVPWEIHMNSVLRPNHRRARVLFLEIEELRYHIEELRLTKPDENQSIEDAIDELRYLQREFWLTGVTSEYDL
jgi:hypothetical protein